MTLQQALGKAIRMRRLEAELSQEQLAERCDVERAYISNIERAKRQPSFNTLMLIAAALEVPLSELIRDAEQRAGTGRE
ncbi:helix-turn-helix domain-containing protein [Marinobacterium arenosum]|uniref:helix-turn-helix domain-containing protein n=1 Tax=Marinobacterium arenosum TaxID=2862496 RepID=UPI001C941665|nr:helix-turn-helix transcriptional regulator [Marinobacterium arenosum]MBY4676809.1 helix-turn-helix domain-containing protein [Marinobacterium arenosum]